MYIKVKNFRCYSEQTFEFEDKGLFLICGQSGKGKSTIMMAINFCLFGAGNKIIKHGETSCSVEMIFDDLKIIRSKRPNRVIVNDKYEDDVAQNIINEKFGTTFNITGYVEQNATNSFIMMGPTDKLLFLEKFAFNDVNLGDIKIRCKSLIARQQMELNKTSGQLEMSKSYLDEINEPDEVLFPLEKNKNREIAMKNEEIRYKNCETKIKKANHYITKTQEELNDLRVLNTYLDSKNENIDNLIQSLSNLSIEEKEIDYIGDDKLKEYKKRLECLISLREINILQERIEIDKEKLNQMKEKEIEEYKSLIEKYGEHLWEEYTKEELKDTIKDTKDTIKDAKQISFLKKQLSNIDDDKYKKQKEEIIYLTNELDEKTLLYEKIRKQKMSYTCPSCDKKLYICDERLHISDEQVDANIDMSILKEEIKESQTKLKNLEKSVSQIQSKIDQNIKINKEIEDISSQYEEELNENELTCYLEEYENYYNSQIKQERKIEEMQNKIKDCKYSSSIILFEKDIKKQQSNLDRLEEEYDYTDEEMGEDELRELISIEEKNKETIKRIENKRNSLENDKKTQLKLNEKQKEKYLEQDDVIKTEEELFLIIKENEEIIKEQEQQKIIHSENLVKVEEYKKYIEEKNKYDNYKKKVDDLEEKEKEDSEKLATTNILKEKILESEMIAIMNTIDTINTHAQIYLDSFFPDYPMTIILKCFKESKKSEKPQINMDIYYKNTECDLSSLSGGELARVVLAFALSLSEMFNTPMLLLDESTASLDEETTAIVFESIKENMKDKPVLVIGHQIVQGIFDKILKI